MKNIIFICFFCLFFCSTCQIHDLEMQVKNWESSLIKNPANPYDSIGELHNQGLDFIAQELENINLVGQDTSKIIFQLVLDFVDTHSQYKDPNVTTVEQLQKVVTNNHSLINSFSADGQNLFKDLETQMSEFKPEMDIKDFQNRIINIENKFLHANISSLDGEKLLKSGVIARYASVYWFDEFQKIRLSKDLSVSVWQKKMRLLYPNNQINANFYNVAQKSVLGNTLAESICFSALRK